MHESNQFCPPRDTILGQLSANNIVSNAQDHTDFCYSDLLLQPLPVSENWQAEDACVFKNSAVINETDKSWILTCQQNISDNLAVSASSVDEYSFYIHKPNRSFPVNSGIV